MNTPIFDPDDPRLTAYALGESSDPAERQAVEELLAASPEARTAVEQTRALAGLLESGFAHEHLVYQQTHAAMTVPANVVPFPYQPRGRRNVFVVSGAVAAALIALGTLILPAVRRQPPPPVASVQAFTPPTTAKAPAPPAVAANESPGTPPLLAEARLAPRVAAAGSVDSPAEPDPASYQKKEAMFGQLAARRPGAVLLAPATPATAAAPAPDHSPATAMVRIRLHDGTFVGGVLLTADGRVLAAKELPAADSSGALAVILPDGRTLPADRSDVTPRFAASQLQIKAAGLPHVILAARQPVGESPLTVARFNARDGDVSLTRTSLNEAGSVLFDPGGGGAFAFDAAGELLAVQSATPVAKAASARAAARRDRAVVPFVRAFTNAERASLVGAQK